MKDKKDRYVTIFQAGMLALNIIAVGSICGFIYGTTNRILARYEARTFLDSVVTIPASPKENFIICMSMMALLVMSFGLRQIWQKEHSRLIICTLIVDAFICVSLVIQLNFNYNGLLLLVFANVIAYVKDGKVKIFFVSMAIAGYLVADYELLSIYMPLYSLSDYIRYYPYSTQQYLFSIYNIMISLNIILFIVYCVYVINEQRGTIEKVNLLYHELQTANEQLKEYADMSERMAQTRERNRLAREIHDTLGHTLTGITAGLDACLAIIDVAPDQTKKQLEMLSQVSRDGIKEIRRSVNELRPDALDRLSLEVAIRKMVMDMSKVSDVEIYFETEEKHLKFDEDEENAIYRVIQESITNAVRHGQAKKIWITLKKIDGEILLVIKDNGIGCEEIKSGFGTKHIKERIEMLKGTVSFDGRNGFTVTARIPIRWGRHMIKVLIADDQELIRQSLQIVLNSKADIDVCDVAADGQEVIRSIRKEKPDVILMDIRMPKMDGVQCTKIIKENYPQIKIIILTTFDDDEYVYNALKFGASGYLLKGVSMDELENAIKTVYSGRAMINPDIATKVFKLFSQMAQADYSITVGNKAAEELTRTEWKIIVQVGKGASNKEIAEILGLSDGTVRNYLSSILNKLDLRDRTQLAIWAVQTNAASKLAELEE